MNANDAFELIHTRRSTRKYLDKPVEEEALQQIVEAGRCAPSGSNSQTTRFFVITDRALLDELAVTVKEALAKMEVTPGMYRSMAGAIRAAKGEKYVFHYNAPALIVTANKKDYGNNMADCACAIENMMVAANALDLGSCWINQLRWLNEEPELVGYLQSLGMKEDERIYGAVIIGYPATGSGLPNRNLMQQKGNEVTFSD